MMELKQVGAYEMNTYIEIESPAQQWATSLYPVERSIVWARATVKGRNTNRRALRGGHDSTTQRLEPYISELSCDSRRWVVIYRPQAPASRHAGLMVHF